MEARPVKIGAVSCTIRALTITVAVLLAIVTTALLLSDPEYGVMPQLLMAVMIGVVTTVQGWILSRLPSVS